MARKIREKYVELPKGFLRRWWLVFKTDATAYRFPMNGVMMVVWCILFIPCAIVYAVEEAKRESAGT